jgi:hypothetical protein
VSDSKVAKFDSCAAVNEKSDELAVDALAKINAVVFKDPQNISAHSINDYEIVLRDDIRISNCRIPPLLATNREIQREYVPSMLESGRIRKSKSETVSPLLFVKK